MATTTLALSDAKARLSSVISQVETTGARFVIEKHGRPVAKIIPLAGAIQQESFGALSSFANKDLQAQEEFVMRDALEAKHAANR